MSPNLAQDAPEVARLREQLEAAEVALDDARKHSRELAERAAEGEDGVLHAEALAQLGELPQDTASKARKAHERLTLETAEAERDARRREHAVKHLQAKLAEAEDAALAELREKLDGRLSDTVRAVSVKLRAAMSAAAELDEAERAYAAAGIKPPHAPLCWQDLLSAQDFHTSDRRTRWTGDAAHVATARRYTASRAALWLQEAEALGYGV